MKEADLITGRESLPRRPAHRPSRRQAVVEASVPVFAQYGYVETSIDQVAEQARVFPTAIYYHFGTKQGLFHHALRYVMEGFGQRMQAVQEDEARRLGDAYTDPPQGDLVRRIVRAGCDWLSQHPGHAQLIERHALGATGDANRLREGWEQDQITMAPDYFPADSRSARAARAAREQHAINTIRLRTVLQMIVSVPLAMSDGDPLAPTPIPAACAELEDICARLIDNLKKPSAA